MEWCIRSIWRILSIYDSLTCKYIDLHVFNPLSTSGSMTNLSLDPLTWIIYQGHLSTRCPPSPTHASTKHVPKSPTYHHKICVCTIPCTNQYYASTMHINTYTIPCANHAHQPCTLRYSKQVIPMVYLNQVPSSPRDVSYPCVAID